MSATTAHSTESFASAPVRQDCSSWLLSAVWPAPSPLRVPARFAASPPPPPSTWNRTTTISPTRPSPPPPTASPRPPPPPRRSWTLEVSRRPLSRNLIAGRPPRSWGQRPGRRPGPPGELCRGPGRGAPRPPDDDGVRAPAGWCWGRIVPLEDAYEPGPEQWVRDQVEPYERTGGREANTFPGRPEPVV